VLALWLLGLAACVFVIARTQFSADLSAFLPSSRPPRSGSWWSSCATAWFAPAAGGHRQPDPTLAGGDAGSLAVTSRKMVAACRPTPCSRR